MEKNYRINQNNDMRYALAILFAISGNWPVAILLFIWKMLDDATF